MELQKLKYFSTVAKYQHVTRSAEHLCVAQPALTQAIKSLEDELGVPLFEKRGRNIVLTEFGKFLKEKVDKILPQIDSITSEIEQLKSRENKTVKLNILAASPFVINAIVEYRKKRDDVIFEFEQNELKYDCDILIATNGDKLDEGRNYVKRTVKEERIFLAVPKESQYADQPSINLSMVKDEKFVLLSSSRQFGALCNKFCSTAGFYPNVIFESYTAVAVENIISTGSGVAFWPAYSWGKNEKQKRRVTAYRKPDLSKRFNSGTSRQTS